MAMEQTADFSRYLGWLGSAIALGLAACLGFVVLVDPYGLYRLLTRPGFNQVKPALSRHIDEIKLTLALDLKPDALIVGNSRAEIGFDPQSPALVDKGYSAFNLAVPGSSIQTSVNQLGYLARQGLKPRMVVIGVDFLDFLAPAQAAAAPPGVRGPATPDYPAERWFWRFDSLLSMTSIKDALGTLLIQSDPEAPQMTSRGFNPLREYEAKARTEGYYALFRQRAQENAVVFAHKSTWVADPARLELLRALIAGAVDSAGEVVLLIYPYHAQILALFEETGLWDQFERWKTEAVEIVSEQRRLYPGKRIALLDFSGYGPDQCETIPARGDLAAKTRWYWEAGHFKQALGDRVLINALAAAGDPGLEADGAAFGVPLDGSTLGGNRTRIARERTECRRNYPGLFAEARQLAESARQRIASP